MNGYIRTEERHDGNAFNAQASDNDYLKMLESEAEDVKLDQSGQLKDKEQVSEENSAITKRNWNWEGDIDSDDIRY